MGIPLQPLNIPGWAAEGQRANPMLSAMQIAQGLHGMRAQSRALALKQQQMAQQRELEQQRLQQQAPLTQAHTQYFQAQLQGMPAQNALRAAQASQIQQQLANPDLKAPGLAGQYGQLEYLRRHYGENSRQYLQLKNAMEQQAKFQQQMAEARERYSQSAAYRGLTGVGKNQAMQELQRQGYGVNQALILTPEQKAAAAAGSIQQGAPPTAPSQAAGISIAPAPTPPPVVAPSPQALPGQAAQESGQTQSALAKQTMTTDQINRMEAANRGKVSFQTVADLGISPFKYSGLAGKTKLQIDRILQSNDPTYADYIADNQALKAAEQDLAMALGVAKTDQSFKRFLPAFDIFSWANNPQVAQKAFNSASQLMHKEGLQSSKNIAQQREDALKAAPQIKVGSPTQQNATSNMVRMRSPTGSIHLIPKDKVEAAKKAGGTVIG